MPMQMYYKFKEVHGIAEMDTHRMHWWRRKGYTDEVFYEMIFFFPGSHTVFHSLPQPTIFELIMEYHQDYPSAIRDPEDFALRNKNRLLICSE